MSELAQHALNDAASQGSFAQLRSTQATLLIDEIKRLCGTRQDGSTPVSCTVPSTGVPGPASLEAASDDLRTHVMNVPSESMSVMVRMSNQLALAGAPLATVPDVGDDEAAANAMLQWEFSAIYALKVASAYAGSSSAAIDKALKRHKDTAAALHGYLTASGATKIAVAEPAYSLDGYPSPHDAEALLLAVEQDSVARWNASAAGSGAASWRLYALAHASQQASRVAELMKVAGQDPQHAEFMK